MQRRPGNPDAAFRCLHEIGRGFLGVSPTLGLVRANKRPRSARAWAREGAWSPPFKGCDLVDWAELAFVVLLLALLFAMVVT
jgi:hypothetical protein